MIDWNKLPKKMQNEEVRSYYDMLKRKSGSVKVKRLFDIVLSLVLILLLFPVMIFIAIWIKFDTNGPVLFLQERVTQYGKKFCIFKFRTMVVNADRLGSGVTTANDSRITKVGRKIRRVRLDELPQLFNVLRGEMSFVGTRPEIEKYVDFYSAEMLATLLLPAGITSQASIAYKDEDELLENAEDVDKVYVEKILPDKMRYNLDSLKKFSLWEEAKILINTISVFFDKR